MKANETWYTIELFDSNEEGLPRLWFEGDLLETKGKKKKGGCKHEYNKDENPCCINCGIAK